MLIKLLGGISLVEWITISSKMSIGGTKKKKVWFKDLDEVVIHRSNQPFVVVQNLSWVHINLKYSI